MGIQNTKSFHNFIVNHEITDEEEKNIEQTIVAFSEYLVAVNPDYIYNKTYLGSFVKEFILCEKALRAKYQILKNKILPKITANGVGKECAITIDGAWKYDKGEIKLFNSINPYSVKRDKMQFEIEFTHDKGFVIAEEINITKDYDKTLDECISVFLNRRKELLNDEV